MPATSTVAALTLVLAVNLTDAAVFPTDDANGNTRKATIAQMRTQLNTGPQIFTSTISVAGTSTLQAVTATSLTTSGAGGIVAQAGGADITGNSVFHNNLTVGTGFTISAGGLTVSAGASSFAAKVAIGTALNSLDTGSALEVLGVDGIAVKSTGGAGSPVLIAWNAATTGDSVFINFYTEASITARGSITYNRAGGLVAYNTTSDYRLKTITGPFSDSGSLIDRVPVHLGRMKGATIDRPMFIAHELEAYAPWSVTGAKDAVSESGVIVPQQVDHTSLVPALWAEVQSLRQRVHRLES
jgi:hypothetical protein